MRGEIGIETLRVLKTYLRFKESLEEQNYLCNIISCEFVFFFYWSELFPFLAFWIFFFLAFELNVNNYTRSYCWNFRLVSDYNCIALELDLITHLYYVKNKTELFFKPFNMGIYIRYAIRFYLRVCVAVPRKRFGSAECVQRDI